MLLCCCTNCAGGEGRGGGGEGEGRGRGRGTGGDNVGCQWLDHFIFMIDTATLVPGEKDKEQGESMQ